MTRLIRPACLLTGIACIVSALACSAIVRVAHPGLTEYEMFTGHWPEWVAVAALAVTGYCVAVWAAGKR